MVALSSWIVLSLLPTSLFNLSTFLLFSNRSFCIAITSLFSWAALLFSIPSSIFSLSLAFVLLSTCTPSLVILVLSAVTLRSSSDFSASVLCSNSDVVFNLELRFSISFLRESLSFAVILCWDLISRCVAPDSSNWDCSSRTRLVSCASTWSGIFPLVVTSSVSNSPTRFRSVTSTDSHSWMRSLILVCEEWLLANLPDVITSSFSISSLSFCSLLTVSSICLILLSYENSDSSKVL